MTLTEPTIKRRWACAPLGGEIECAPAVLNAACAAALAGLRKLAKGGLEVGGLLFGERANGLTRILATRPIACEHRFGPSFVLSDTDKALLAETLEGFRSDSELRSLELLGCYFSHSRHGAALTDHDIELFERYFGQADKIALLLIPNVSGVVQGTLLARNGEKTLVSCHHFEQSVVDNARVTSRTHPPRIEATSLTRARTVAKIKRDTFEAKPIPDIDIPTVAAVHIRVVSGTEKPIAPVSISPEPRSRRSSFHVRSSVLAGLLILFLCWPNHAIPVTQIPLSFADNSNGELIIRWDTTLPSVRTAVLGMLDILDGEQKPLHVSIGPDLLQRGWLPYQRKSDLVRISFTLAGHGLTISDKAIYFAPEHTPIATPAPAVVTTKADPAETQVATTLPKVPAVIAPPREAAKEKPEPKFEAASARAPEVRKQPRAFRAPLEPVTRSITPANTRPALLPEPPALPFDGAGASAPPLHAVNLSLAAPRPSAAAPSSGRLIWTGQLPKHSILALSAQGASLGYLNGWIPKGSVHIEVRAGELIEGGMVIFTKEQTLHSESPSLSNGWNTVMYKPDAARASELEILEAPGPSNGWSHIILRNGARALSVIVVDWRTEQN